TPEAVAVVFEDRTLSYAELEAHANRLAQHLRSLGAGPETIVGLCLPRSAELVIGLLGILKAGAAYLPLDPDYPQERLAEMAEDAGVSVVLTLNALIEAGLLPPRVHRVALDRGEFSAPLSVADGVLVAPRLDDLNPENLAYLIYTSGSTGRP